MTTKSPKKKETAPKTADENAPGRLEIEGDVAYIHLDNPGKRVNTLSVGYFGWFEEQIDALAGKDLRGLVFVSDKEGYFIVGADVEDLQGFDAPEDALAVIRRGHELVNRFADLPFPVISAIDGLCLGGGLELSLGCDLRIATTAKHTKLGLPEVNLGLFPGLGGTQRLPRLIGVPDALELILTGKQISARKAKKLGLVDETCDPLDLDEAIERVLGWGKPGTKSYSGPKQDGPDGLAKKAGDFLARVPFAKSLVYDQARDGVMKKSGGHYPAPLKAIEVVREGLGMPLEEALELEAREFSKVVVSDVAKGLISIFFTKNEVEERAEKLAEGARDVRHVGVLGAGFMGSGVAQLLAHKEYGVVLKDRDHDSLARGLANCSKLFENLVRRRRYTKVEKKIAMSRLLPTVDYEAFGQLDFVIEAVFEDVGVKHKVIRELEEVAPENLIFASNTSTIPIARLAEASRRPENVVGMHFFSPVHKMPLLEIIRHPKTSEEALATTVEVGRKMGKSIIVVNDGPGFFTSRVLGPFVNEALWCLDQGAKIEEIDKALTGWGWPVGPLALLDEVGLDIAQHAGEVIAEYAGDRVDVPPTFDRMIEAGRLGRKAGKGFYRYRKGGKKKRVDESVYELLDWEENGLAREEIIERCWLQMLNEVARTIEDGIISNPKDVDLGVVFGFGFPPFRGGILREADKMGLEWVVERLDHYAERYGKRLEPAQLLRDMAKKGESFHEE